MNVQCHACMEEHQLEKTSESSNMVSMSCQPLLAVFSTYSKAKFANTKYQDACSWRSRQLLTRALKDQIYDVYRYLTPCTQVVILSATLPYDVLEMTTKFYDRPDPHSRDSVMNWHGGYQAVLCGSRKGRFGSSTLCATCTTPSRLPRRDFLQHKTQGGRISWFDFSCINSLCNYQVDWLTEKMRTSILRFRQCIGEMPQKERDAIMAEFSRWIVVSKLWQKCCRSHLVIPVVCWLQPTFGPGVSMSNKFRWLLIMTSQREPHISLNSHTYYRIIVIEKNYISSYWALWNDLEGKELQSMFVFNNLMWAYDLPILSSSQWKTYASCVTSVGDSPTCSSTGFNSHISCRTIL